MGPVRHNERSPRGAVGALFILGRPKIVLKMKNPAIASRGSWFR
jgi:hypothetical protein